MLDVQKKLFIEWNNTLHRLGINTFTAIVILLSWLAPARAELTNQLKNHPTWPCMEEIPWHGSFGMKMY